MHAIPNALHPIIMNQGARFDYMVKGELEIAIVLGIPTLGPLILSSVYSKDMYVVSAIFMLVAGPWPALPVTVYVVVQGRDCRIASNRYRRSPERR